MKKCPFPQANNMELIYQIFFDIGHDGLTKFDITKKYGLTDRQGSYYLDALLFLGVVEKVTVRYFLNEAGKEIRLAPLSESKATFANAILRNEFLSGIYQVSSTMASNQEKKTYIGNCIFNQYGLGFNTSQRRASTIIAWFDWIGECEEKNGTQA